MKPRYFIVMAALAAACSSRSVTPTTTPIPPPTPTPYVCNIHEGDYYLAPLDFGPMDINEDGDPDIYQMEFVDSKGNQLRVYFPLKDGYTFSIMYDCDGDGEPDIFFLSSWPKEVEK